MAAYRSPLPTIREPDFVDREPGGHAPMRRKHVFTNSIGIKVLCRPRLCRECWREANWTVDD